MSEIGKGDWVEFRPHVECPPEHVAICGLSVGAIYQVAAAFLAPNGSPCIDLVGVTPWRTRHHYGFSVRPFRPIYRPKQSIIEALKAPPKHAPKRTREDA